VPIRQRLTLFNALAIGSILLVLGLGLFLLLRQALLSTIEETTRSEALGAARIVEAGEEFNREDLEELALVGVFVTVRDEQGEVLEETAALPAGGEDREAVWRRVLDDGQPEEGTVELSSDAPAYVYAVPVAPSGGTARVVEAAKSYKSEYETIVNLAAVLVFGILAALALSVGAAYLLARTALSPVEAVVRSAREITEGDLSKRLPVAYPKDEIGRLATTMNDLLARLEMAFARREEALARQRRFTADASHELRTPLTSVGGYARMLESWGLEDPGAAREGAVAIRRETERMRRLVEGLLTVARGDEEIAPELAVWDLAEVAEETTRMMRAAADGKVKIKYTPPERRIPVAMDEGQVRRAVSILLENAVKFTPAGGRVTVTAREENGRAEIEVSDTGIGIPEEQQPLVFDRFYRADEARATEGTGLGLTIACQIAEAHGGGIRLQSEPGKGSTFVLSLPKTEDTA
jgi:two-component system OmpR family sensor kinase